MRTVRLVISAVVIGLTAASLGGCTRDEAAPAVDQSPPKQTRDESDSSPVNATVQAGNASATVQFRLGTPRPASSVSDESVQACVAFFNTLGSDGAVAIPMTITASVTSSPAVDMSVHMGNLDEIENGAPQSSLAAVRWGVAYSQIAPQCATQQDAVVHWDASSGVSHQWSTWAVGLPSSTDSKSLGTLVLQPAVTLGYAGGVLTYAAADDSPLVRCGQSDDEPSDDEFLALIRDEALEAGCRTVSGASETPITDRLCHAQYPSGSSSEVGGATVYDRESSLYQLCEGFGKPEGLTLTPAMQCALIAAAAELAPEDPLPGTTSLCNSLDVTDALQSGDWAGPAAGKACEYLAATFAGGAGVVAAGAASETGPAAVAVGVGTAHALNATLDLACGGLLDGGGVSVGQWLEARHETAVRADVLRGKCLSVDGTKFSAVPCES